MKRILPLFVFAAIFLTSSRGEETVPDDKSHYTIFNPTPTDSLRVWRTDHAGAVPYTIDAGHFETDITGVSYGYDEQDFGGFIKGRTESWSYGITQIKVGLLNRLDAEVILRPYQTVTDTLKVGSITFSRQTASGFGDVVSRLKLNVWGDDSGKIALSISGIVKYPTAKHGSGGLGNGQFEGGPSLEFAAQLPWGFELRIDGFANFYEDNDHARQVSVESLASLSHQIVGHLEGYCMFDTVAYTSGADWLGQVKIGLTYRVAGNVEIYAGNYFGVTDRAWDYQPFLGIGARF